MELDFATFVILGFVPSFIFLTVVEDLSGL